MSTKTQCSLNTPHGIESLITLVDQMTSVLPVVDVASDGSLTSSEAQERLLQEVRAKRDAFVQEKARVTNLLNSAIEKVKIYEVLLGMTESQVCKVEDLIGDIRFRLRERGVLLSHTYISSAAPPHTDIASAGTFLPATSASPLPALDETVPRQTGPESPLASPMLHATNS
ncbi:hypothetical protein BJ322DRAFT_1024954 [Thelephora terrestris]|uniref:Uncharacterized protein n=1 Tax=Thelephora terrestris TaxID=56493 RepID=A0A9P6H3G5_9AGAM|nr:hypothetical protein BJ322DRAFT_1114312 [Thelephora terrestris]KAF9778652.1 hypothetical protein BJ322DRAFT_1024954 [Thelephora terrestris]